MVLLVICLLAAFVATVLVLSAVVVGGRARRFEKADAWWLDEAQDEAAEVADKASADEIA